MSEYAGQDTLAPYNQQAGFAEHHTQALVGEIGTLVLGLGGVRAVATGVAADFQQMTSGMSAATRVTHQSATQLTGSVRMLSREFPVSTRAALETVQAVQSLGLTAKGQEREVAALAKTVTQLSGATGEAPAALAAGFGQLTREMASLDPKRVQNFADVLTTSSARSGASAGSISNFAKAIAPMAQAAGAGEASVLGVATSFAKLGDDGYVAANAVSKMFSDINRAVRDGSNDMAGYANAVGMTIDQFRELYKADPAGAVARVTQSIGKMSSGQAQRTLDELGIDGQRAQRAFLEQAQSGGMMADIAAARQAYGSGSTKDAASVGFGTTLSGLTRLGNAAQDVAVVFERPLLRSANSFISLANRLTGGAGAVLRTGPVGHLVDYATQAAVPLGLAMAGGRLLSRGAMASFLLRSGPVTGAFAGFRAGRLGGIDQAIETVPRSQPVLNMLTAAQANQPLGIGYRANLNLRAMQMGTALGSMFESTGTGPGLLTRLRGAGVVGAGMALRSQAELMRLARTDPLQRDNYLARTYGSAGRTAAENIKTLADTHGVTSPKFIGGMAKEVDNLVVSSAKAGTAVNSLGRGMGSLAGQMALTAGSLTKVAGAGIFRTLAPMLGPMAVLGGGMWAFNQFSHRRDSTNNFNAQFRDQDVYSTLNAYRDSMGKAGETSITLADQLKAAGQAVAMAATTFRDAAQIGPQDSSYVARNKNVVQYYSGNEQQVASQIQGLALGNLQPSDVQGAKYDLMRLQQQGKLPANFDINKALGNVGSGATTTMDPTMIANMVGGINAAPGAGGFMHGVDRFSTTAGNRWGDIGARTFYGMQKLGGPQLGKQQKSELGLLTGALGQERSNLSQHYGGDYATGRTLQDMNRAMAAALKTRNADLVVGMERAFAAQLGVNVKGDGVTAKDIQNAGGFTGILAQRGVRIGGVGVGDLVNTGQGKATMVEDPVARDMQNVGSKLSAVFSNFAGDMEGGRKALADVAANPGDLGKQRDAVLEVTKSSMSAGMSLGDLAKQAAESTQNMAEGDARRVVMAQVVGEATRRLQNSLAGMNIGQQFAANANFNTTLAATTGNTQDAQAARAQGVQGATDTVNAERSYMQQRLMQQYNFQKQMGRANRDFILQQGYAYADEAKMLKRQREDAARTLYDPYTRIQVQPVWDAANLIGNSGEQINAMRQQIANIKKLKSLGMTEATVQMLGLYTPDKAQQAQELVMDLQGNAAEVRTLNNQTKQRTALAGQLITQDPAYKRQQQDFTEAMARQRKAYETQIGDAKRDLTDADRELTGNMATLQADMIKLLKGQAISWTTDLTNNLASTISTIQKWTPKLLKAQNDALASGGGNPVNTSADNTLGYAGTGGKHWTGNPGTSSGAPTFRATSGPNKGDLLTGASKPGSDTNRYGNKLPGWSADVPVAPDNHRLSGNAKLGQTAAKGYGWGDGVEWAALFTLWNRESSWSPTAGSPTKGHAYGIPQAYWLDSEPDNPMANAGDDWRTNPNTQLAWGLNYIANRYGDPLGAYAHERRTGWYATGGIATGPSVIGVGEGGNEAILPLNGHGVGVLADALKQAIRGADDLSSLRGGGATYATHISNDTYTYDQGQHFHAPITVKANSPAEWATSARAQQRKRNLTAPRSVNWSRP